MTGRRLLVLVGTDHHGFDRAVAWADAWQRGHPDDEVVVQHGRTAPPAAAQGMAFLTPAELRDAVAAADVVITHGGPGTISDARRAGHRPIVFPRDPAFGEHVDDHQRRFGPWCAERGLVLLALDPAALEEQVAALPATGTRLGESASQDGAEAVAAFAALVAVPAPERGRPGAPDAPRVLLLCGADDPEPWERQLATRPGTLLLGSVLDTWPAGVSGSARCSCGLHTAECALWSRIGEQVAGASPPSEPVPGKALRRHPGRAARADLLSYAEAPRRVLRAASEVGGAALLVVRAEVWQALVLSHDRHLDLRVADLGLSRPDRARLRYRRLVVDRWADATSATAARRLDGWAPAQPGWSGHPPIARLSIRAG